MTSDARRMTIYDQMAAEHPELDRYLFRASVTADIDALMRGEG